MNDKKIYEMEGRFKSDSLVIYEEKIEIVRGVSEPRGETTIFFKDIVSIQIDEEKSYLHFSTLGGLVNPKYSQTFGGYENVSKESSFRYNRKRPDLARAVYQYLLEKLYCIKSAENQKNEDIPEQILKFKKLYDEGVLTESEFQIKKQELLLTGTGRLEERREHELIENIHKAEKMKPANFWKRANKVERVAWAVVILYNISVFLYIVIDILSDI